VPASAIRIAKAKWNRVSVTQESPLQGMRFEAIEKVQVSTLGDAEGPQGHPRHDETAGAAMNHRPGAMLAAGRQTVLPLSDCRPP
jgi:hypothetical protein